MLKIHTEKWGYSDIPPWRWSNLEEKDFTVDENEFMLKIIDKFGSDVLNDINNISETKFDLIIQITEPQLINYCFECEVI